MSQPTLNIGSLLGLPDLEAQLPLNWEKFRDCSRGTCFGQTRVCVKCIFENPAATKEDLAIVLEKHQITVVNTQLLHKLHAKLCRMSPKITFFEDMVARLRGLKTMFVATEDLMKGASLEMGWNAWLELCINKMDDACITLAPLMEISMSGKKMESVFTAVMVQLNVGLIFFRHLSTLSGPLTDYIDQFSALVTTKVIAELSLYEKELEDRKSLFAKSAPFMDILEERLKMPPPRQQSRSFSVKSSMDVYEKSFGSGGERWCGEITIFCATSRRGNHAMMWRFSPGKYFWYDSFLGCEFFEFATRAECLSSLKAHVTERFGEESSLKITSFDC